jgi:hypothetical protein
LLLIPSDPMDSLTPLGPGEQVLPRLGIGHSNAGGVDAKHNAGRQKPGTLTNGGRCRYKSIVHDDVPHVAFKAPLSPLEASLDLVDGTKHQTTRIVDENDMSGATPEMRTRKIKSLYQELQVKQEKLCLLQNKVYFRDQQISERIRENVGMWAISAHIANCIGVALDEEANAAKAAVAAEPMQPAQTPVRQNKRRRSSLGVASLTKSLNKSNKQHVMQTPNMAKINGEQLLELEGLFATPGTGELYAAGDMVMSPLGDGFAPLSSKALRSTGMCPVQNNTSKFATLTSPVPLGNFNAAFEESETVCGARGQGGAMAKTGHELSLAPTLSAKENSFSFGC